LFFGLTNSVWSALIGLAVVPFYLKYLGIEAYGLIGFYATVTGLLQLLDLGLTPTLNREIARSTVSGSSHDAQNLLHTLAVLFWCFAGLIAVTIYGASSTIATHWLQSTKLTPGQLANAVALMGLVIAARWPIGLYQSALIGSMRIPISSTLNIGMVTLANVGSIVVLAFVSRTINAFFLWQGLVGLIYALTIRFAAWRVIGTKYAPGFDVLQLKRVWRFSFGMGAVAITSIAFTQMDKAILSKILTLEEFGHYILATTVVSGLYLIVAPVFNVMYPRFCSLVADSQLSALVDLYRMGTRAIGVMLFPLAMLLVFFSRDIIELWTGDASIASNTGPVIAILAIGSAMHGVMFFPYSLQLAFGMTRLPIIINLVLMTAFVPAVIFLCLSYRALGGAIAWAALEAVYLVGGTWLTHRFLLKGVGRTWLFHDVLIPFIGSIAMMTGIMRALEHFHLSTRVHLSFGVFAAMCLAAILVFTSPALRSWALVNLRLSRATQI
jgi:O-antigen/teichoic acid export membrane protein